MQEEVEQKVVILIKSCTKLTADELRKAMSKVLAELRHRAQTPKAKKQPRGKMSVKELAAQARSRIKTSALSTAWPGSTALISPRSK